MTLRDEIGSLYSQLTAPDRLCDECGLPLLNGERRYLATVQLRLGHLVYSICEQCRQTDTPKIKDRAQHIAEHLISKRAATILLQPKETVR